MFKRAFVGFAFAAAAATSQAGIITNGDFESGNTGFSNDYQYKTVSDYPNYAQYGVTHSSWEWSQFWSTIPGDHTTGAGQFLIADVGPGGAIWRQTVSVPANVTLTLTGWLSTWTSYPAATLLVVVDGAPVATWGGPPNAAWSERTASWTSGPSGTSTIELVPASFFQPGDDIAVDDLNLVPAPGAGAMVGGLFALAGLRRRR